MSSLTKAERAEMAERAKRAEAKIERDAAKGDYTPHEVEMALQDIPELLAHIEALEAVVVAAKELDDFARAHGLRFEIWDHRALKAVKNLRAALQRLKVQEEEKEG